MVNGVCYSIIILSLGARVNILNGHPDTMECKRAADFDVCLFRARYFLVVVVVVWLWLPVYGWVRKTEKLVPNIETWLVVLLVHFLYGHLGQPIESVWIILHNMRLIWTQQIDPTGNVWLIPDPMAFALDMCWCITFRYKNGDGIWACVP